MRIRREPDGFILFIRHTPYVKIKSTVKKHQVKGAHKKAAANTRLQLFISDFSHWLYIMVPPPTTVSPS